MSEDSTDDISDMEMTITAAGQMNAKVFHMSDSSEEEGKQVRPLNRVIRRWIRI